MTDDRQTVLVAGGGYAGLLAANRLAGKLGSQARVVLVTLGDSLTDRIRLHEAAARGHSVTHPLRKLLHPAVERIDARVVGVDPQARRLTIERGEQRELLHYDWLVLALGSRMATSIPAHAPHALALGSERSAHALWRALHDLADGARVAVIGGGLTAIELAAELAEAHPRLSVELFTSELAPGLRGPAQQQLRQALSESGVTIRDGQRVLALSEHAVQLADGVRVAVDIGVLAAGFACAPLGEGFLLSQDPQGRIPVDAQLRVQGLDNVFAVGDLAAPPTSAIGTGLTTTRMGCASAMPQGAHAADQIARAMAERPLLPYRFSYFMQCISVGRQRGIVASVDPDDRPSGRVLSGRMGALVKELVCRFVLATIRLERLFAGLYAWPGRHGIARLPRATPKRLPG